MAGKYILTIDVGTSSTKTAVWDVEGRLCASATGSYSLQRTKPLWAEIDAELWWQAIIDTTAQVLAEATIHPDNIIGIGIDGVGWTLIPVDQNAKALSPAMLWLDRRASAETEWLNNLPQADHLVSLAANPIDEAYITPKLLWLKNNKPSVFEAAYRFLTATGYLVAQFTGEFSCDFTQAYGYHFFDIANERWDADAASQIGIPIEKMPPLVAPTEIIGAVTARAARETGLRAGIPVIAGCLDAAVGALGAGVTKPGKTNEQGGQAGGVGISLTHVLIEPRLIFSHHVLPGQYLLAAGTVGGGSLGWFRDQLGFPGGKHLVDIKMNPFELMSQQASQSPPGSNGLLFLPYMAGERTPLWSSIARGVFFGLSYQTSREDILRAIMEGCAFAVYDNLSIAQEHGIIIDEFLGSGGATKSDVWCQIKADIYGRPFVVAHLADGSEGGHSLGLFAMTANALGVCDEIGEFVDSLLPSRRLFEPSAENHTKYQALFKVYHNVSRKLLEDFADLDEIRRTIL